jgi:adenylate cyclase
VRFTRPSWRILAAGSLIGLSTALLAWVNPFRFVEVAELKALDARFALRGPRVPASPVVIVTIDEDSFDDLQMAWPWPRALHGRFIDAVSKGDPAAIALDILFAEPSPRGEADDRALAGAVARSRRVVLSAALSIVDTPAGEKKSVNPPIPEIREGAAGFGFINFEFDVDAFVRRASLASRIGERDVASFDVLVYRLAAEAGLARHPLPRADEILINYSGGPGTFPRVAFHRVVRGEVPPETFTGKIVLLGSTTPTLHDVFPTPFAPHGGMPGVEIHANVLETLLEGIPIRRAPATLGWLAAAAAGIASVWAATALRPVAAFGVVVAAAAGYLGVTHAAFLWARWWLPAVPPPLALAVAYAATVAHNFAQEQREKRRLSRFFSPAVVSEIVRAKDDSRLGASRRRMTVLFSDIRGFTSMSEKMPPEEVVTFLREYLTVMTEAVFKHGGTVDKYIGDAIMALYNVPFEQPDHALRAVRTALEFQERLRPLAERFEARYGGTLACGVGIHTGDAVVGTIGSEQRLEYTAIGDTVNLGSRLESLTKDFNVPIIISEATYVEVRDHFSARDLGEVAVKGKAIPVKIYAVLPDGRREPRTPMEGKVSVSDGELTVVAQAADLSRSGLQVRALPKSFQPGQVVRLQLEFARLPRPITVARAQVVWARDDAAGFRFLEVAEEERAGLDALLAAPGPPRGG